MFSATDSTVARARPNVSSRAASRPHRCGSRFLAASTSPESSSRPIDVPSSASERPPSTVHVARPVARACASQCLRVSRSTATPPATTEPTSTVV
ncbi:hypothetical protein ADL03_42465 [Nocardia sp. NRRL S-836]|nr:hypothetical protein ADL03_42465 [Nocardia sp. NRRL S-836]